MLADPGSKVCAMTGTVRWAPARDLAAYLEHDGDINDEEYGGRPGAHLDVLAEAGAGFDVDEPLLLAVTVRPDGRAVASVLDGNHRLLLTLADDPDALVPYRVVDGAGSRHPGFDYDGSLGW